jgi:hypothetical protein
MKIIFTCFILLSSTFLFAQKTSTDNRLENLFKLDLGLRGIGVSYEPRLGKKINIDLAAGLGGGYDIWTNSFEYNWQIFNPAIYLIVNPKFYYNRNKRLAKAKSISRNSGNYIGMAIKYTTPNLGEATYVYDALLFNLHWGLQRPIGKRWTFNTHVGVGYATDATDLQNAGGTVYPAMDLRFAYVFGYGKGRR